MTGPVGSRVSSSMRAAVFEYLATSSMATASPRIPAPEPPYSTGMHRPEQAGVAEGLEEIGRVGALLVDGAGPGLHLVLGEPPHRVAELEQFVWQVEMHR